MRGTAASLRLMTAKRFVGARCSMLALGVYGRIAARFGGRPIIAVSSLAAGGLLAQLVRSSLLHLSSSPESSLSEEQS